MIRVYLAGKITGTTWREELVPTLRSASARRRATGEIEIRNASPIITAGLTYAGPYRLPMATPAEAVALCRRWIATADVVFCWLADRTAYGTIAEVGYAVGLGKPVYLYRPPGASGEDPLGDLWFVQELADRSGHADDAGRAFKHFRQLIAPPVGLEEVA